MKALFATGLLLLACFPCRSGVLEDLELLRERCLCFAAGHAPTNPAAVTIRHGLYAQSPFSPAGQVDLAASGFSLAALPAAVANGVLSSNQALVTASNAAHQVRLMVAKSAAATAPAQIELYGYAGVLFHYPVWNDAAGEFQGVPNVEISPIDTALLLYGLLVSAEFFGGSVRADYEAARDAIRWRDWLDTTTSGHQNQFRMAYRPGTGLSGWWDWYTQEAMLICIFAAMSDSQIHPREVWRGWHRDFQTYTSPPPASRTFSCCATYFGDPFTVFYGLAFLDFARFPPDLDGVNWFRQGQTAYQAHVEFFRAERGYRDSLTAGFSSCSTNGVQAKPNGARGEPVARPDATVYTVAGGLQYDSRDPGSNALAATLSRLVQTAPGFFAAHGWPAATVNATNAAHESLCDMIVGQDVSLIGLAIDNFLTSRAQNLVLQDPALRRTLNWIFPPQCHAAQDASPQLVTFSWAGIPFSPFTLQETDDLDGHWAGTTNATFAADGTWQSAVTPSAHRRFYRLLMEDW